jgi:hypothetical protein
VANGDAHTPAPADDATVRIVCAKPIEAIEHATIAAAAEYASFIAAPSLLAQIQEDGSNRCW